MLYSVTCLPRVMSGCSAWFMSQRMENLNRKRITFSAWPWPVNNRFKCTSALLKRAIETMNFTSDISNGQWVQIFCIIFFESIFVSFLYHNMSRIYIDQLDYNLNLTHSRLMIYTRWKHKSPAVILTLSLTKFIDGKLDQSRSGKTSCQSWWNCLNGMSIQIEWIIYYNN